MNPDQIVEIAREVITPELVEKARKGLQTAPEHLRQALVVYAEAFLTQEQADALYWLAGIEPTDDVELELEGGGEQLLEALEAEGETVASTVPKQPELPLPGHCPHCSRKLDHAGSCFIHGRSV